MGKVTRLPNPLIDIEATIRRLAHNSAKVFMSKHAEDRLVERKLTMTQVYKCLQSGDVIEGPTLNSEHRKGWMCRMQILSAGEMVQVACKLIEARGDYILVITVI